MQRNTTKMRPTPRERELLTIISRIFFETGEAPYSDQLLNEFNFNKKYITTLIERLEKKGFLERKEKRPYLTDAAFAYLSSEIKDIRSFCVIPTQVKVRGTVTAGRVEEDVNVHLDNSVQDTLQIPHTSTERNTYALRVVGRSMEHENIYEGDYVIVENFTVADGPINNEMIVTKYCPIDDEVYDDMEGVGSDEYISDLTLKIFKERVNEKNGQKFYELGWKKDNVENPYVIYAKRLMPVGRVIGVYRSLRRPNK